MVRFVGERHGVPTRMRHCVGFGEDVIAQPLRHSAATANLVREDWVALLLLPREDVAEGPTDAVENQRRNEDKCEGDRHYDLTWPGGTINSRNQ